MPVTLSQGMTSSNRCVSVGGGWSCSPSCPCVCLSLFLLLLSLFLLACPSLCLFFTLSTLPPTPQACHQPRDDPKTFLPH